MVLQGITRDALTLTPLSHRATAHRVNPGPRAQFSPPLPVLEKKEPVWIKEVKLRAAH